MSCNTQVGGGVRRRGNGVLVLQRARSYQSNLQRMEGMAGSDFRCCSHMLLCRVGARWGSVVRERVRGSAATAVGEADWRMF